MKHIAIITGASGGIGKEFTLTLPRYRKVDEVWVIARNKEKLEQLQKQVPFSVRVLPMDLSEDAVYAKIEELLQREKPDVKLLINCSGYGKFEYMQEVSLPDNLGMIDLNCKALTAVTYCCLPYMRKGSEVVNIASVAAFQPIPGINVYSASKAYVLHFSRALNRELKPRGIRVFAVCPFWTRTGFFDRAVNPDKQLIKYYAAMYDTSYVVSYAWKAMKNKRKDYCIPGMVAKGQVLGVKLLPHKWIMDIWQRQQKMSLR